MKCLVISCWLLAVSCWSAARADDELPRNPFWPQGYEGVRRPISAEPRFKPEPPEPAVSNVVKTIKKSVSRPSAEDAEDYLWREARATLRFGNDTFTFESKGQKRQTVCINGLLYGNGDLVSINHESRRFTWLVLGLGTNNTVRLQRMRHRELASEELEKNTPVSK